MAAHQLFSIFMAQAGFSAGLYYVNGLMKRHPERVAHYRRLGALSLAGVVSASALTVLALVLTY